MRGKSGRCGSAAAADVPVALAAAQALLRYALLPAHVAAVEGARAEVVGLAAVAARARHVDAGVGAAAALLAAVMLAAVMLAAVMLAAVMLAGTAPRCINQQVPAVRVK